MKTILDTNFLLDCVRFRIDLFEEFKKFGRFELYILRSSLNELDKIKDENKKLALQFAEKLQIIEIEGYADDILVDLSNEYTIATNDRELRKRIKEKTIFIRQKKYLVKQ